MYLIKLVQFLSLFVHLSSLLLLELLNLLSLFDHFFCSLLFVASLPARQKSIATTQLGITL